MNSKQVAKLKTKLEREPYLLKWTCKEVLSGVIINMVTVSRILRDLDKSILEDDIVPFSGEKSWKVSGKK